MSISGITHTALSGMLAQSTRANAIADNLANSSTRGYSRLNTSFAAANAGSDVQAIIRPNEVPTDGSEIDLAAELTELIETGQNYKANATVFETGADLWDMLRSIKHD